MSRAGPSRLSTSSRRDPLALLKLANDIPLDAFPALKQSANSTLCIVEEVKVYFTPYALVDFSTHRPILFRNSSSLVRNG